MKNQNKNYRPVLHNELNNDDYTLQDAKKDLEEAIKKAWNTKNGNPECTYRW